MIAFSFLRSVFASFFFVVFTAIWSIFAMVAVFLPESRALESWILSTWGKIGLKVYGVDLKVSGLENIPKGSCLFLFNHTSFFDIFAMVAAFSDFRFGAKIELFKIPLFGPAMRRLGVLPIARHKREEVFRVYQEAQERVKRGEKFALSPEGQRNVDETLLPFKSGPFIFGINSQMPLVPVVIRGAHDVLGKNAFLPNWDRWYRTITIDYLPPIDSKDYTIQKRLELQDKVYAAMKPYFSQNPTSKPALSPLEQREPKSL